MKLITGANGMLGSYINWDKVILTDIGSLDVTDKKCIKEYLKKDITHIIHLAAETDLEKCEREPGRAYKVNAIGSYNMTSLAIELNIPIIYISTAGVFDGQKKTPYTETDTPNPINVYGVTKAIGEQVVRAYPKHYIFRAGWMMGGGPKKEKKFVGKIIQKIKEGEDPIYAIDDAYGSPTYAKDLVRILESVIAKPIPYGTYHTSGDGCASRFDVACEIVKGLSVDVGVEPKKLSDYSDGKHSTVRSSNETMDISKLKSVGLSMRNWKTALSEYLEEWL